MSYGFFIAREVYYFPLKAFTFTDSGGLYIQIQPKVAKYWRLAYQYAEKQKTLTLGTYPEITLADARSKKVFRGRAKKILKR